MNPLSSVIGQTPAAQPERSGSGRPSRGGAGDGRQLGAIAPVASAVAATGGSAAALQDADPLLARPVIEPGLLSRQDAPASRRGALMLYALTQGATPGPTGSRLDIRV